MSQRRFVRQLNWNAAIEDWTPRGSGGDKLVFWTAVACAIVLVLL